ncbi:RNA ligase family protein [Nocardiopsis rhodophaea]|uniref:RNA ligase family protein n=1 Tax=Nocardiopsis rhodophaea TaxID=280238 RepID=UPI0031D62F09
MVDPRNINLDALNSATKYPSIPTYHELDKRNGGLLDEATEFGGKVILTEKVDGTNSRLVLFPTGDYIIGSREELLHARGDLIANPALGIVDALRDLAERLTPPDAGVRVYFLEVYGGRVTGASKQYTGTRAVGYRMFDAADVPAAVLTWDRARISAWREEGGQSFLAEDALQTVADKEQIPLTPRLGSVNAADLPTGIQPMRDVLSDRLPSTQVALDEGAGGRPEGIVLRTPDRSVIAKARIQDYDRTLKRQESARKK